MSLSRDAPDAPDAVTLQMGSWGDGEMGSWGDGEMGRWGRGITIFLIPWAFPYIGFF
ncbi:MAG: hypothetical protein F6K31_12050 [Symploca sp. SIO2G7]|nr:hypothetical protein [Symploca sp. SIO2G7]